jgi:phospholipid/cholesterol/gamma-HCH transport system substrate-binding protein
VVIAGVEIGRVKKIDLDREEYEAVVRMLIDNDINLQEDVMASIKTKGLIGEKFIEITLGGADELIKKDGSGRIWETEPVMDIERIISLVMSNMGGGDDE